MKENKVQEQRKTNFYSFHQNKGHPNKQDFVVVAFLSATIFFQLSHRQFRHPAVCYAVFGRVKSSSHFYYFCLPEKYTTQLM